MNSPSAETAPSPFTGMLPVYKREVRAAFHSPIAYIVSVVFLAITGYFFAQPLFLANLSTLNPFTDMAPLLLVFFMPALTMRLYAEERKAGTLEILDTMPIAPGAVLLAKYLGALTVLAFALAATAAYPLTIALLGTLDWGAAFGAYLGLFLTGAALAAIGLFCSSLTRNQITAFLIAFLIGFIFFLLGKVAPWTPPALTPLVRALGIDSHVDNLGRGVVDLVDLVYFAGLSGFFLFLAGSTARREGR